MKVIIMTKEDIGIICIMLTLLEVITNITIIIMIIREMIIIIEGTIIIRILDNIQEIDLLPEIESDIYQMKTINLIVKE
jgi:hypothetical protein